MLGAQLEPGDWDNEGEVAYVNLPDGRTALLISFTDWAEQAAQIYIVNPDGTPSAGPFDVQRFTTTDQRLHALDLAWDGAALGAFYTRRPRLSQEGAAWFARIDLTGTVVSAPVRVDDDRPAGTVREPGTWRGVNGGARLIYDPTDGYTALSFDSRDFGGTVYYGVYSRHLGQTGATPDASRLLLNPEIIEERPRTHRLSTGDIDFFVPVSTTSTVVLRLNARGAPRATSLTLPHDINREHMPRGVLEGSAGPELLFGPTGTFYPGSVPRAYWFHGADYGVQSTDVGPELNEYSAVFDGPTGPLHTATECCGDFEVQRIEQLGPGQWAPIEPPLVENPSNRNFFRVIPTGPLSAIYTNGHYIYPIQFSDCQ